MKLPLILPVPLLAPAFVSIFAPKIAPKAQPADLDRIGYDTIKNAPPEAGKEARAANLAALFGGDLSAPAPTAAHLASLAGAAQFSIPGVTLMHTQGVIKNIIPAIASTNAIVAAACANEAFKIVSNCAPYLNNNLMYMGDAGLYAPTFKYEKNPTCLVCGAGVELETAPTASLTQLLAQIADDARLRLKTPSVRVEGGKQGDTLYMRGVLEAQFAENLEKTLESLFDDGATLHLTDPSVPAPVKLIVKFKADDSAMVP